MRRGLVASGASDATVRLWQIVGPNAGACICVFEGHREDVTWVAFDTTASLLASCSWGNETLLWCAGDHPLSSPLTVLRGHKSTVAAADFPFQDNGRGGGGAARVLTCSFDHTVKTWDTTSGRCVSTLTDHTDDVCCLQTLISRPRLIVTGSQDCTLRVYDAERSTCLATVACGHMVDRIDTCSVAW
eukprot:TRINITY_DN3830_c0_g2_i1.p1 TRINITY_DN3830_c0_g2~~TRINITY_DN3830_c0_g2_i1.p1  ORF type:complete len:187 (-),score=42.71 TRINITY_DN3830_c0_g2_i1:61-621(-)